MLLVNGNRTAIFVLMLFEGRRERTIQRLGTQPRRLGEYPASARNHAHRESASFRDLDERDARKGLSPKSLNRRECTPRKKRMQEIFNVPHENFLLRDYFLHESLHLAGLCFSLYAFGLTGALTAG